MMIFHFGRTYMLSLMYFWLMLWPKKEYKFEENKKLQPLSKIIANLRFVEICWSLIFNIYNFLIIRPDCFELWPLCFSYFSAFTKNQLTNVESPFNIRSTQNNHKWQNVFFYIDSSLTLCAPLEIYLLIAKHIPTLNY